MKQIDLSYRPDIGTYRPDIDGLRALAVMSVVLFHVFPSVFRGGFVGVDIFFVISGYLITSHIYQSFSDGTWSLIGFFGRRIRRLFPALIVVTLSSLLFGWLVLLPDEFAQLGKHLAHSAAFIVNFTFAEEVGYFDNAAETKPLLHLWSLAVEEQFYIFWPLALLIFKSRYLASLIATIFVFAISVLFASGLFDVDQTSSFFWPFGRFWELLSGAALAWFFVYVGERRRFVAGLLPQFPVFSNRFLANPPTFRWTDFFSVIGVALICLSCFFFDKDLRWPSFWTIAPVLGACLLIMAGKNSLVSRVIFTNRVATFVGLISYPLYLWHWPLLSYLRIIYDPSVRQ